MADSPCDVTAKINIPESKESSYGTFLATGEKNTLPSSNVNSRVNVASSSLAFIDVSYEVPSTFGWLPGVNDGAKTILRPVRYVRSSHACLEHVL